MQYINNYGKVTMGSIINTLIFEGYEFETDFLTVEEVPIGDMFCFDRVFYIRLENEPNKPEEVQTLNLNDHKIWTIGNPKATVKHIKKCGKMGR